MREIGEPRKLQHLNGSLNRLYDAQTLPTSLSILHAFEPMVCRLRLPSGDFHDPKQNGLQPERKLLSIGTYVQQSSCGGCA